MRLWKITVEIRERATNYAYPVVVHSFLGRDRAEAFGYFNSHLRTDTFFDGCVRAGRWQSVECLASTTYDGWIET